MKSIQILATAAVVALASAKTIRIDSGPTLVFKPDNVTAEAGDLLEFHFYSKNHSVAQGDFASACQPVKTAGFFSGYVPVSGTSESVSIARFSSPSLVLNTTLICHPFLHTTGKRLHRQGQRHQAHLVLLHPEATLQGRHGRRRERAAGQDGR